MNEVNAIIKDDEIKNELYQASLHKQWLTKSTFASSNFTDNPIPLEIDFGNQRRLFGYTIEDLKQ
jgi:hypothetical protein